MNVIALNGSPRKNNGDTALILNPFIEGMIEEGADVELHHVDDLKIYPCHGDFACWTKTPGICPLDDDMNWLNPQIAEDDLLVLASPVYCDGFAGPMKTLMDRMIPNVLPFMELREGHSRRQLCSGSMIGKIALVSSCSLWEMDNFDAILAQTKAFCRNANAEFAGALLRPHGDAMEWTVEMGLPIYDILDAAREAGRQIVKDGKISGETSSKVSRELIPRDVYIRKANQMFEKMFRERTK